MRKYERVICDEFAKIVDGTEEKGLYGVDCKHSVMGNVKEVVVRLEKNNDLQREPGEYVTFEVLSNICEASEMLISLMAETINNMAGNQIKKVLFLGMGNSEIVSDALGVETLNKLDMLEFLEKNKEVKFAKFSPSVFAVSGLESFESVLAIQKMFKADLVIVVDSLCTKNIARIGTSFQLTDAGIIPGSAVGNNNCKLSSDTLGGAKVISIGVPVVVYLQSVLEEVVLKLKPPEHNFLEALRGYDGIYSPKEIDEIVSKASSLIAKAIKRVFI